MKWLLSITIIVLFSLTLVFSANATESDITSMQPSMHGPNHHHMPHPPWDDWFASGHKGHHGGNFKIADLDDGNPGSEIIILEDETLIVMNNQGDVLFTKAVEDIEDHHGWGWFMPGHDHNGGEVGFEVVDLDDDGIPEIIILDTEKLIVLDNKGDLKSTIPLPEVDAE